MARRLTTTPPISATSAISSKTCPSQNLTRPSAATTTTTAPSTPPTTWCGEIPSAPALNSSTTAVFHPASPTSTTTTSGDPATASRTAPATHWTSQQFQSPRISSLVGPGNLRRATQPPPPGEVALATGPVAASLRSQIRRGEDAIHSPPRSAPNRPGRFSDQEPPPLDPSPSTHPTWPKKVVEVHLPTC